MILALWLRIRSDRSNGFFQAFPQLAEKTLK